ncbi:hypothetical protein [Corynebacterium sp. HMSC071B10]|uniref:hypothetical protein n=1 Tax=Corynebacterium sp. HMSC071B10 TaxID=1739494 RepID=UPI0008A4D0A7|nr:hypothetical protein [Corynebacterium sp. HMSC071B10]OFP36212.1 hypothetical protein HMPREF2990_05940 [Corynebacterium sp. HMSC071B10]
MTRRSDGHGYGDDYGHGEADNVTEEFAAVANEDAFLDALAAGVDPSDGNDPLAAMLLELKADIDRPMPAPPRVEAAREAAGDTEEAEDTTVVPLRRKLFGRRSAGARRGRTQPSPWVAGLVGAAAATAVVTGSGAALYNATPGSPLWGPATAVFGDRTAAVELASTLDELQAANDSGDRDAASALFDQARKLLASMEPRANQSREGRDAEAPEPIVRTKVSTVTVTPPPPEPQVVTETVQPSQPAEQSPQPSQAQPPAQQPSESREAPVRPNPLESPSAPTSAQESGAEETGNEGHTPQETVVPGSTEHTAPGGGTLGEAQNY